MKKKLLIFMFLFIFGLGGIFAFNSSPTAFVNAENNTSAERFIIRSYGDSIAYGLNNKFTDLIAKGKDLSSLDESEFTDQTQNYASIFSKNYCLALGAELQLKGVSGDTTTDLLADLTPYVNADSSDDPEDMQDFKDTDIVTLCIGANNVLGPALDNLGNYISGDLTDEDYRGEKLQPGLDTFAEDYPKILQAFKGKKVVVMTIYNPYKYLTLKDMNLGMFQSLASGIIANYDEKLQQMIATSMEYLNGREANPEGGITEIKGINEIIREKASENVYVVDVWDQFETFSPKEYSQYINANMSNVKLEYTDIDYTDMTVKMDSLMKKFTTYCDPHPTAAGHEKIAEKHLDIFKYFKLSCEEDFTSEYEEDDKISFDLSTFETGEYSFKLYKQVGETKTLLKTDIAKFLQVAASEIEGEGEVYVEVYNSEGEKIYTTNSVAYNVTLKQTQPPVEPSDPEEELLVTIETQDSLTGVKDKGDVLSIALNTNSEEDIKYVLYKKVGVEETEFANILGNSININVEDIVGQGSLYVKVLKNGEIIYTTNSIDYQISLSEFSIACEQDLTGVIEQDQQIKISITTTGENSYTYKLYKNETLIKTFTTLDVNIDSQYLDGNGELYVEVYKSNEKITETNHLTFNLVVGSFTLASSLDLNNSINAEEVIEFRINSKSIPNALYRLIKEVGGQTVILKTNTTGNFNIQARQLEGKGNLYVEVYSNNELFTTTNKLSYSFDFNEVKEETKTQSAGDSIFYIAAAIVGLTILVGAVVVLARFTKRNPF